MTKRLDADTERPAAHAMTGITANGGSTNRFPHPLAAAHQAGANPCGPCRRRPR